MKKDNDKEKNNNNISEITLSYTFYPVRVPDQAAVDGPRPKSGRIWRFRKEAAAAASFRVIETD